MRWSRVLAVVGMMLVCASPLTATAQPETEPPAATVATAADEPIAVLSGAFDWVAIAADPAGARHLVASSDVAGFEAGGDLWYATDRTGAWTSERLLEGQGCRGSWTRPDIAVDGDGSAHIVTALSLPCDTPGDSRGIYHLTDSGRSPGDFGPSIRVSRRGVEWPSVAVRDGVVSLVYARVPVPREPTPVTFSSDRTGEWRTQRLTEAGSLPSIALDAMGRAHVVFADRRGLRYARQASDAGPLSDPERIPTSIDQPGHASLDLDAAGRPALAWVARVEMGGGLLWSAPTPSGWGVPVSIGPAYTAALSFDGAGRPHIAYVTTSREAGDVVHGVLDGEAWTWTTLATSDSLVNVALDTAGTAATVAWAGGPEGAGGVWVRALDDAGPA
jgi:hypothetical protein